MIYRVWYPYCTADPVHLCVCCGKPEHGSAACDMLPVIEIPDETIILKVRRDAAIDFMERNK